MSRWDVVNEDISEIRDALSSLNTRKSTLFRWHKKLLEFLHGIEFKIIHRDLITLNSLNFLFIIIMSNKNKRAMLYLFFFYDSHLFFSFFIQQPLFNVQPSWIFNKLKVRGGLDNTAGKSGNGELNSKLLIRNLSV